MARLITPVALLVAVASQPSAAAPCPCSNSSLCEPITRAGPENVYAFHTTGAENWRGYDWSLITTVCVFGDVDPELLCHAHANNARVTLGNGGLPVDLWRNTTAVNAWVSESVQKVSLAFADGFNIDIEHEASEPADIAALTMLTQQAADAMHAVNPHAHVTFDVPSEGLVQEGCGKQYGRDYDYAGLANATDFLVVMDYDSNDAHHAVGQKQTYLPRQAPDYIYVNRSAAADACVAANLSRLCTKDEIEGFNHCANGWCSDFEGYWMSTTTKGCGHAGFNNGSGPAGAYCCSDHTLTPCSTCYFANAALPVVQAGVTCFAQLQVPAEKLVLAFPWYGYDYQCAGDSVDTCVVTAAAQVSYPRVQALLQQYGVTSEWLANSSTPYFGYRDTKGITHRVDFDDSRSLRLKYNLARQVGARGVGMWTASGLNYSDTATVNQFWTDLKVFRPNANATQE